MKYFVLQFLAFVMIFQSCNLQKKDQAKVASMVLEGFWSSKRISNGIHNRPLIIFFNDSTSSFLIPEKHGLILVDKGELTFESLLHSKMSFKVIQHDKTNMTLIPMDSISLDLVREFSGFKKSELIQDNDIKVPDLNTLNFYRLKKQNNKNFSKISFRCGPCGGQCDVLYLRIDNSGDVMYYGNFKDQKNQGFNGKVKKEDLINIKNTVNLLPLKQIKKSYFAPWTNDQECNLRIDFSDGTSIETSVYGFNDEPVELRALLFKLMNLSKSLDLKHSSKVNPYCFIELGQPFLAPISQD